MMRCANQIPKTVLGLVGAMLLAATAFAPSAFAQSDEDRRLDRLDKDLHELRAIVFQGRDTGQPVVVRPAGPDPEITAMGQRLDNIDNTLRQVTGQIEVLTHDADEARQTASSVRDENGELRGQLKDLTDRVAKLEAGAAALAPPPPPPASAPAGPAAPSAPSPSAAVQTPPPAAPPTPAAAYRQAREVFAAHDYAGAAQAFEAFISQYPNSPEAPTAYYWLGESETARQSFGDAVPAYANALKGWPRASWASDATVNLARALAQTNHTDQACAALGEFDRRYRAGAGSTVRARAAEVRSQAKCGA